MKSKITKYLPLMASVAIHLGVLGVVNFIYYKNQLNQLIYTVPKQQVFSVRLIKEPPKLEIVSIKEDFGIIKKEEIPYPITPDSMKRSMEKEIEETQDIPEKEKVASLEGVLPQLKNVRPKSIDEIIEWFNLKGYKKTNETGAKRFFDINSMNVWDIEKKEYFKGRGYEVTFIDKYGTILEGEVFPDEVDEKWNKLYEIYEMIEQNPLLEKLFRSIGIQILGKKLEKLND